MGGPWDGYADLMPDEVDLGEDWKKVSDQPPATSDLLLPFQYAPDRRPDTWRFDLPDGMVKEIRDELKDGCHAACRFKLPGRWPKGAIRYALIHFVREMEGRTKLKLALAGYDEEDDGHEPVHVEDFDGTEPAEVRFRLVPL